MKTVSIFDLRDNLATYLTAVHEANTSIIVRRFGNPIALITPYKEDGILEDDEYFGFMPKGTRGSKFLSRLRHTAKEKKRTNLFRAMV